MKKNEAYELNIIGTTLQGDGVAKIDGRAVFVKSAVQGDVLVAHILNVKKNLAYAKISKLISPSHHRIKNDCSSFPRCGGCAHRHIDYQKELEIKSLAVKENMRRIGDINIDVSKIISGSPSKYRNKAQFPLASDENEIYSGFYAERSHRVIKCNSCDLGDDKFDDIIKFVCNFAFEHNIQVYDEITQEGLLRHVYLRSAKITGEIMIALVINGKMFPYEKEFVNAVTTKFSYVKSIVINENRVDTNVVLGEKCKTIFGNSYITDQLCGLNIRISPLSFYQVNHDMTEALYKQATIYASPHGKTVIDLYCGAGTIGLSMAGMAKQVIGVEIVEAAVKDAIKNAEINNISNARFICADATVAANTLAKETIVCDVVILDPPRKGCDRELINTVCSNFAPERIVYISCDSATLARDCKILKENGYSVKELTVCDLFPRTKHVECCVLLNKTQ